MNILHISNDYLGSAVYKELYAKLADEEVNQTVYCPLRDSTKQKRANFDEESQPYKVVFSGLMKKHHRFLFKKKIRYLYNDINRQIDFEKIDIIHTTTWFSDGAIAYQLYKTHNIPYIVTIRNTDLNLFFKYMLHLRALGMEILRNAQKIIFISPVYLKRFTQNAFINKYVGEFEDKMTVIANGINDFWIYNTNDSERKLSSPVQLLYVGKFTKGKNVSKLIDAVEMLNRTHGDYVLNLVGGGGGGEIEQLIKKKDFIVYHGKIYDKQKLKTLMNSCHIFTMPSKSETFGLVYIEALSQGLPVVYTKNEGIDGFYNNDIGESVYANDIESIRDGILRIANNYKEYDFVPREIVQNHNWKEIAQQYIDLYNMNRQ